MILGPVTWAGSNWRKLCARVRLDPLQASADDVALAIEAQVTVRANRDMVNALSAAHAFLGCLPDLSDYGKRVLADVDAALSAAMQRGD